MDAILLMPIQFEKLVAQDINRGYGPVHVTMPDGTQAIGDKVGLHTWTGIINVTDFGAAGDGLTDDTAAIQTAIDTAAAGGCIFFPAGRYRVTTLVIAKPLTLQGTGANSYNADLFGSATWSRPLESGSMIESAAVSGAVISFVPAHVEPLNVRDVCIKGLGGAARTTVGIALSTAAHHTARCLWSNVTFLNLHTGLSMAGCQDCVFTNVVVNGCHTGVSLGLNSNQNVFCQLNAMACDTGLLLDGGVKNYLVGGAMQGCGTWAIDVHGEENDVVGVYFENVSASGGAIICRGPRAGDANTFRQVHLGTPRDNVQFESNGNVLEIGKYSSGAVTFGPGSHYNQLIGNHSGAFSDLGNGNWWMKPEAGALAYTFSRGAAQAMVLTGGTSMTQSLRTAGGVSMDFQVRDDLSEGRIIDLTHNFGFVRFKPDEKSPKIGFYNAPPVARPVLATNAGHTVDDVIGVLQSLGLVKQG
jgi:hypothetical protein